MGDGAAERPGRRARHVDVDPLVVARRLRERVHTVLLDGQPVAGAEVLADGGGEVVEAGEGTHRGNLAGLRRSGACPSPPESPPPRSRSPAPPRPCCTTTSTEGCGRRRSSTWRSRSATRCPRRTPIARSLVRRGGELRLAGAVPRDVRPHRRRDAAGRRADPGRPRVRGGPGRRRCRVRRGALRPRAARDRRAGPRPGRLRGPARLRRGHGRQQRQGSSSASC